MNPKKVFPNFLVLIFSCMVNGQVTTNHSFNKQFKDLWLSKSKCIIGFKLYTTYFSIIENILANYFKYLFVFTC